MQHAKTFMDDICQHRHYASWFCLIKARMRRAGRFVCRECFISVAQITRCFNLGSFDFSFTEVDMSWTSSEAVCRYQQENNQAGNGATSWKCNICWKVFCRSLVSGQLNWKATKSMRLRSSWEWRLTINVWLFPKVLRNSWQSHTTALLEG